MTGIETGIGIGIWGYVKTRRDEKRSFWDKRKKGDGKLIEGEE